MSAYVGFEYIRAETQFMHSTQGRNQDISEREVDRLGAEAHLPSAHGIRSCVPGCHGALWLIIMELTAIKYSCPPRAFRTFSLSILFVLLSFLNFSSEFCRMLFAILSKVCRQPGHRCFHPPWLSQRRRA